MPAGCSNAGMLAANQDILKQSTCCPSMSKHRVSFSAIISLPAFC
jgi:hypothetical protein